MTRWLSSWPSNCLRDQESLEGLKPPAPGFIGTFATMKITMGECSWLQGRVQHHLQVQCAQNKAKKPNYSCVWEGGAPLWSQSQLFGVFDSWLEPPWLVLSTILQGACSNIFSSKMPQDLFLTWIWREGYNPSPLWSTFHQARFSFSCKPLFPFWCDLKKNIF